VRISQEITDKFSIGLSLLCAIHCLALPIILVLLPSLGALQLQDDSFHIWMLIAVIPTSVYALIRGCNKHKNYRLLFLGILGLSSLTLAVFFGYAIAGESGEKALTVLGSMILVLVHWRNFSLCQKHKNCTYHQSKS